MDQVTGSEQVSGSRLKVAGEHLSAHAGGDVTATDFYAHSTALDSFYFPYTTAFETDRLSGPTEGNLSAPFAGGAPLTNAYYVYSYDGKL
ncbi:MAG: hypothetical protein GY765_06880, partial [bacterium]|nr:hypothetical protein [bacterium]